MHEAQYHDRLSFITLTYDQQNEPPGGSLRPHDLWKFFKRLRKALSCPVRYFACGEYGELSARPHYHALIFGWHFPDRRYYKGQGSNTLYVSEQLSGLWPAGMATVGDFSYETANYVAGYVMKKVNGEAASAHYAVIDPDTGEILMHRVPEFIRMSRRPGIAAKWWSDYGKEVFPDDFVVVSGRKHPVPRYYLKRLKADQPVLAASVLEERVERASLRGFDRSPERLRSREAVAAAKTFLRRRDAN